MKTTAELALELIMKAAPNTRAKALRAQLLRRQVEEGLRAEAERRDRQRVESTREVITHIHRDIRTG